MKPADRLLEALRACGRDQYRADPDRIGVWHAYCPGCASHMVGVRRLTIVERDDAVSMTCSTGCSERSILTALKVAERWYPHTYYGGDVPGEALPLVEDELAKAREARRLVSTLSREVSDGR
jgi:hypothetical protein